MLIPPEPGQHPDPNDPWADDTWNMPLPSQEAALDALAWNWGEAYDIGCDDGQWWYRRRDGLGGTQTARTPDDLRIQIAADYLALPVPYPPQPTSQATQ